MKTQLSDSTKQQIADAVGADKADQVVYTFEILCFDDVYAQAVIKMVSELDPDQRHIVFKSAGVFKL